MSTINRRFFSFEGVDGSGKTTTMALVADRLTKDGIRVATTREPGGTQFAEALRNLVLHNPSSYMTQMFAMLAARQDHIENVIVPALERNFVVLTDRFIHSTIAYQVNNIPQDLQDFAVDTVYDQASRQGIMPWRTFIIKVDRATIQKRVYEDQGRTLDEMEKKGIEYQLKVQTSMLHFRENQSFVIDGLREQHEVVEDIYNKLTKALP